MPELILHLTKSKLYFFQLVILKKSIKYVNFDPLAQSKLLTYDKLFENSVQGKLIVVFRTSFNFSTEILTELF